MEKLAWLWEVLLENHINSYMLFAMPDLYKEMDHTKPVVPRNMDH